MIVDAPEILAPCTPLKPSGPQPTTATIEPGSTSATACDVVAPSPATLDAAAHHAEIRSGRFREHRHDPLFERDHELGQPADVRVRIDRRAITHVGHRHEIVGTLTAEELAHVRASAQALIAGAALRCAGDADAIAHLHAAHLWPDGFDDANAAVALNERHRAQASAEVRSETEHRAGIRITEIGGLGADDDLASANRPQRQILKRRAAAAAAARDPSAKPACGDNRGALGWRRAGM